MVSSIVASIQGQLLFFIFKHFVRFLFEGGFYLRAVSIQENTVCWLMLGAKPNPHCRPISGVIDTCCNSELHVEKYDAMTSRFRIVLGYHIFQIIYY